MKKCFRKLILALAAICLLFASSGTAFAYDPPTAAVTTQVPFRLTESGNVSGFVANGHTYTAVRIFDLHRVMNTDGTTPRLDANNNYIYWYRPASAQMTTMLNSLSVHISYNSMTGAILKSDGVTQIANQAGNNENTSDASALAVRIARYCAINSLTGTTIKVGTNYQLQSGYYILYETANSNSDGSVATKPILIDIRPEMQAVNVTLKDASIYLDKDTTAILNPNKTVKTNDLTAAIGDYVEHEITSRFPIYENPVMMTSPAYPSFTITDTLSGGLDTTKIFTLYVNNTSLITNTSESYNNIVTRTYTDGVSGHGSCTITFAASNRSIILTFDKNFILYHEGQEIRLVYTAKVNQNATANSATGNNDQVTLTYTNNPEDSSSTKQLTDEEKVWTYGFKLVKLDGAGDTPLAGATMKLYDSNNAELKWSVSGNVYTYDPAGTVTEITTLSTGPVEFCGLDEGTYTLRETSAPAGYSLLANAMTVQVTAKRDTITNLPTGACTITTGNIGVITSTNATESNTKDSAATGVIDVTAVVRNYRGVVLPQTGSNTAIIMMIAGTAIVIVGVIFLAVLRRKDKEE